MTSDKELPHSREPDPDVAAAGGWKSLDALRQCYQRADDATNLQVVLGGGELRKVGL
jgi:hypothetical protein